MLIRAALLLMGMGLGAAPVAGQETKAILVLHTFGQDAPERAQFDLAFARTLRQATDVRVDLYVETLDPNRFGAEQQARTRTYLREKYAGKNVAALAVVFDAALTFALDDHEPLFADVPVAAVLTGRPQSLPDRVAVIWASNAIGRTAALARSLTPRAAQMVVIDGVPPSAVSNAVSAQVDNEIQGLGLSIPVSVLRNLPLEELLQRVRGLPPESIILLVNQFIGRQGRPIANGDALSELARVAPAPIYGVTDQTIGFGALGGNVLSLDALGSDLAKLALRVSADGAARIPPAETALVPMFDWRELRRWGISEARLPSGSMVRFRQLSVWDQYKFYIVGALAIVALQGALIAGLVVQGRRRRSTELALRESEKHFRIMADTAPILIWRSTTDRACDFFNQPWLDFRGRTQEQESGSGWSEGVHPDDLEECLRTYLTAFDARQPFEMEYRLQRADGEYRWVLDTGVPRYEADEKFVGFIGSALDITERKRIEQQNHELAGRLISAQEAERARIARDLHDDLSQQLASLAIMLSGLKRSIGNQAPHRDLEERFAALQSCTAAAADAVRNLSHELHPSVLEHGGLVASLRRHCAEIERHHHLEVSFTTNGQLDAIDPDVALCLFRVSQEALTNAVRHAQARSIRVDLRATPEGLELRVDDDGIGFASSEHGGGGLGLRSIHERVRLIRGRTSVESRAGHGTTVLVRIPLPVQKSELVRAGV